MQLRICIVVPTYNNSSTLSQVIEELLKASPLSICVIDDGSIPPVSKTWGERVTVLTHGKNQGKGAAIQTAIAWALSKGFTHLLTIDADGQHSSQDIAPMVERAHQHPWALVMGVRNFEATEVPSVSRFGRRFSNFWVKFETGTEVGDSQTGFRIYPLFHLQTMRFLTRRYDFEIEVMIRLLWRGVKVEEVPISVAYPANRVSHFNKWKDNVRISFLNAILVSLSLLHRHTEPRKSAIALAIGVWVGTTPFFGFHTPIGVLLSLLFRLNFPILWVGTQISIPPIAPFLAGGSLALGTRFFKVPFFMQWLLGSLILGAFLGLCFGLMTYLFLRSRKKNAQRNWTGRSRGGSFGNWILKQVVTHVGLKPAYFLLYFLVPYFYLFAPKGTRGALQYWRVLHPEWFFFRRHWQVLVHYHAFGKVLLDRLYRRIRGVSPFHSNPNGFHHILDPIQQKQGILLVSGHIGSWDMASQNMQRDGMQGDFYTVQFLPEASGKEANAIYNNQGQFAVLEIQKMLKENRPIALMSDRPTTHRLELASFMGKLIAVDITPFRIATLLKVPLLMTFGFKGEGKNYDFYAFPAKRYEGVSAEAYAQEFADRLSGMIRRYPTQWFNFYSYFSSIPNYSA